MVVQPLENSPLCSLQQFYEQNRHRECKNPLPDRGGSRLRLLEDNFGGLLLKLLDLAVSQAAAEDDNVMYAARSGWVPLSRR